MLEAHQHKYGDKGLSSDGVKKLLLKGDVAGKSKILIQGKDGNLPLPPLPLDPNGHRSEPALLRGDLPAGQRNQERGQAVQGEDAVGQ